METHLASCQAGAVPHRPRRPPIAVPNPFSSIFHLPSHCFSFLLFYSISLSIFRYAKSFSPEIKAGLKKALTHEKAVKQRVCLLLSLFSCPSSPLQCPRHLDHRRHSFQLCPAVVAVVAWILSLMFSMSLCWLILIVPLSFFSLSMFGAIGSWP